MAGETAFRAPCDRCGNQVAVKINVAGKAYYTCDHCGFKGQDTWQKSSDSYVAQHTAAKKPAGAPPADPAPSVTPPKPAPARGAGTILG